MKSNVRNTVTILGAIGIAVISLVALFIFIVTKSNVVLSIEHQPYFTALLEKSELGFSDFYEPYDEKIHVFSDLIAVSYAKFIGEWNTLVRILLGACIALASVLVFIIMLFRTGVLNANWRVSWILVVIIATSFLYLRLWEQWFWGGQNELSVDTFGLLIACLALIIAPTTKRYRICLIIACVSAAIASLTNVLSLWLWPVFAIFFLFVKTLRIYIIPWILVGCMVFSLYFWNFPSLPFKNSFSDIPFLILPTYMSLYVAGGLVTNAYLGALLLLSFVFLSVFLLRRFKNNVHTVVVWILLGCYCIVYAFFQGYVDMDFSIVQSTSSEAYGISILFLMTWLALLFKLYHSASNNIVKKSLSIALVGIMASFLVISALHTNIAFQNLKSQQKDYLSLDRTPMMISNTSWEVVPYKSEAGHVDVISYLETGEIQIIGWAQHPYIRDIVEQIHLVIDGESMATDRVFIKRRDVSEYWQNDIYRDSGWMLTSEETYDSQPSNIAVYLQIDEKTLQKLN